MQTSGFVDQLLDIHRDGNAFRNAARACAGFGSFRKQRRHSSALSAGEVERIRSNLMALLPRKEGKADRNFGTIDRHVAQSGTRLTTINRRWKYDRWPSQAH